MLARNTTQELKSADLLRKTKETLFAA